MKRLQNPTNPGADKDKDNDISPVPVPENPIPKRKRTIENQESSVLDVQSSTLTSMSMPMPMPMLSDVDAENGAVESNSNLTSNTNANVNSYNMQNLIAETCETCNRSDHPTNVHPWYALMNFQIHVKKHLPPPLPEILQLAMNEHKNLGNYASPIASFTPPGPPLSNPVLPPNLTRPTYIYSPPVNVHRGTDGKIHSRNRAPSSTFSTVQQIRQEASTSSTSRNSINLSPYVLPTTPTKPH